MTVITKYDPSPEDEQYHDIHEQESRLDAPDQDLNPENEVTQQAGTIIKDHSLPAENNSDIDRTSVIGVAGGITFLRDESDYDEDENDSANEVS